ncbi:hypothetical protein [Brevibacterium salitolerans]|uniref:C2H2-type domain-containing protein n=1 Tax=Brevibacterium salitolerans TaxID=1403566 RepID=A0ABN2WHJ8_9MICO
MIFHCDCGARIYGDDEMVDDHLRAHDNEDDPGASDLGGEQRTGAGQDQNHQEGAQPMNKTTHDSTAAKLKPIHPAPFGTDDDESPTHASDPCMVEHMGDTTALEAGDTKIERYLSMETTRPDWRLDPEACPSMVTTITDTRTGDEVTILSDHPGELRVIARFLPEAADELEQAQRDVAEECEIREAMTQEPTPDPFTIAWTRDGDTWGVVNEETGQLIVHSLPNPGAAIDAAHAIAALAGGDTTA